MINYSSYNDVWGISPDILNKNSENNQNKKTLHENFNNNNSCNITKCDSINHILKCEKCLKKLKKKLNIDESFTSSKNVSKENFSINLIDKFGLFNDKVKNMLLMLCDNNIKKKRLLLILLILLFIILSFLFVKGRGVESKSKDIEALAEAVGSIDVGSMKYLKENFIMIPKNMINFNNIY